MQESESCQLRLLDRESLTHVCSMLDPVTVANLSCTCRELRDVSFQNCLWERFSRHRWRHLNADLHARVESPPSLSECQQDKNHAGKKAVGHQIMEPPVDFRSLYANNNGWTPLHLRKTQEWAFSSDHLQYCASRVPASNFCDIAGDALYTLACEQDNGRPSEVAVSLWSTGDRLQAGRMLQTTSSCVEGNCITELAPGIAAVGAISGEVSLHDLRPEAAKSTHPGATWWNGKRYQHRTVSTLPADKPIRTC